MSRRAALVPAVILAAIFGGMLVALPASAEVPNLFTGCVRPNGTLIKLKVGTAPRTPCATNESQISIDNGDVTAVTAGQGLTGGGTVGGLTLSADTNYLQRRVSSSCGVGSSIRAINSDGTVECETNAGGDIASVTAGAGLSGGGASGDVTLALADGSVTPDRISNDASEASRVYAWTDVTDYVFDATGGQPDPRGIVPTTITVTVPAGKAYNYLVTYDNRMSYESSERTGSNTSFYGQWAAELIANSTVVSTPTYIVLTGLRYDWSALGATSYYWVFPSHAVWAVRLTEGTHTLKVQIRGYSDGTMNSVHFSRHSMNVIRVF